LGGCFGRLSDGERRDDGAKGEGLRPCGLHLSIKAINILKHKNRLNRGDNYGNKGKGEI